MKTNQAIVTINGLSHRYSRDWAIKDISFEVARNEILGLLGSNGAGKSTTMNILCGVLNQTKGSAQISGIEVNKEPVAAKKLLGFLPQKAPLYTEFKVKEYLSFTAGLRRLPKAQIKGAVDFAMERCGIAHFSNRLISNLSGGYQQRVGIAQAIIHKPMLVVLDEPTNGLDPVQIVEVRKLIREISRDHAVILSTHILSEVDALCDRVCMIEQGALVFSDSLKDFRDQVKSNSLIVEYKTPVEGEILAGVAGVEGMETLGANRFRLRFKEEGGLTANIVDNSTARGWELKQLYYEQHSLDDVFKKISQRGL